MKKEIKEEIESFLTGDVLISEPLSKHTYFKIGGPAELLLLPADITDLKNLLLYLKEKDLTYKILGNGSNLLVSDQGVSEVVIKLSRLNEIRIKQQKVTAGAGVKLPLLARKVAQSSLSGLEFSVAIPASVGGAVVMNAGAYGGEIKDNITEVETVTAQGETKLYQSRDLDFSYRDSYFKKREEIITKVNFALKSKNMQEISNRMENLLIKRKQSQPLQLPNAGCIFKNPPGDSAGRLIDAAGAKGMQVGGAEVSTKHANFIINRSQATADDVFKLAEQVRELVADKFGIDLETEINFWH